MEPRIDRAAFETLKTFYTNITQKECPSHSNYFKDQVRRYKRTITSVIHTITSQIFSFVTLHDDMRAVKSIKCTGNGYEDDDYKSCSEVLDTYITYEEFVENGICECDKLTYKPARFVDDYLELGIKRSLKKIIDPVRAL